jgi:hypothetical protein
MHYDCDLANLPQERLLFLSNRSPRISATDFRTTARLKSVDVPYRNQLPGSTAFVPGSNLSEEQHFMIDARHLTTAELEAGLPTIRQAPKDGGILQLIVRRPQVDQREVLPEGELDLSEGLVGDTWNIRGSTRTPDGLSHPDMQLNIMNARSIALVAMDKERWQLAGDQLYVDLDLSVDNLPPGTRLAIGSAIIEVTAQPHRGCKKFRARFGGDALKFVNSTAGVQLNLRGINAKVVKAGAIRVGDEVRKV